MGLASISLTTFFRHQRVSEILCPNCMCSWNLSENSILFWWQFFIPHYKCFT
jgi:hypothetical protein